MRSLKALAGADFDKLHRRGFAVAAAGAAIVLAAGGLTACSENKGDSGTDQAQTQQATSAIATDPKESQGPAAEVPGAKKGGTLRLIQQSDFEHIDPQRTYTQGGLALDQMFLRTLTVFKEDGKGKLLLVGDIATDAGKDVKGDCTQWEYTLKKGVKFEDGREVTAKDVAYGIARSFEDDLGDGATYLQEWLAGTGDFNTVYKGPISSGSTTVPGLTVKDDYTLDFSFKAPQCDLPYALSMPTTVPVPQDKDTGADYDRRPFATGPYKIKEYVKDTRLVLERNPAWDPKTDPIRHDYPDSIAVEIGPDDTAQTERMIADSGDDQYAIPYDGVPQALVNQVLNNTSLKERTINQPGILMYYLTINNDRIKDVNVRKAIAYALDKEGVLATQGGDAAGKPMHTLVTDTTIGWQDYPNPYDGGPHGDPAKAKELLGGKPVKLVFMARNNAFGQGTAPVVKESLEKAGFQVTVQFVDSPNHNPTARTRGNPYDIHISNWYADWPSAASTIPPLWDGRKLGGPGSKGNSDVSYFNADDVNAKIDEAAKSPAGEAGPKWAEIDRMITEKYCPVVPIYQQKILSVHGSKVGGDFLSAAFGTDVFYNVHLK
jgi:peptide/nickel transport system substrate-binding protein